MTIAIKTWPGGQVCLTAEQMGRGADFQNFTEVDKIGFSWKYRPIADRPKLRESGSIYQCTATKEFKFCLIWPNQIIIIITHGAWQTVIKFSFDFLSTTFFFSRYSFMKARFGEGRICDRLVNRLLSLNCSSSSVAICLLAASLFNALLNQPVILIKQPHLNKTTALS